jgi:ribosomal-protein-alanine N-acetyltransferase
MPLGPVAPEAPSRTHGESYATAAPTADVGRTLQHLLAGDMSHLLRRDRQISTGALDSMLHDVQPETDNVRLTFSAMGVEAARAICGWKYPSPYNVYTIDESDAIHQINYMVHPTNKFQAIYHGSRLCGFMSVGKDAHVMGGDYREESLDIGMGLLPEIAGRGMDSWYVSKVIEHVKGEYDPKTMRVTIAEFNERAIRVWVKNGFQVTQRFRGGRDAQIFVVLTRTEIGECADECFRSRG